MTEVLSATQMCLIERAAISSGTVSGLELMERAAHAVVDAVMCAQPRFGARAHRAAVLCGPGNNGGDGFVVARLLCKRGWDVQVFLYGTEAKLPPDAGANCRRWRKLGAVSDARVLVGANALNVELCIDALFGTGLSRPLSDDLFEMMRAFMVPDHDAYRVSVDILSGLDADSGRVLGGSGLESFDVSTDLSVTFHRPKCGHYLGQLTANQGQIAVRNIGLDPFCDAPQTTVARLVAVADAEITALGKGGARALGHKYDHGHALVLAGGSGHGGAARLAAQAALRIGAGLVTLACPHAAVPENAAHLTAVMTRALDGSSGLAELLSQRQFSSICLGPGLGLGHNSRDLVEVALKSGKNCVLDADGLSAFENQPEALFDLLHAGCVVTPHGGEFKRLFPDIFQRLTSPAANGPAYSKIDAARAAAARAGCVVLLKGPDTVIADANGHCAINAAFYERGAPWLATAGSGDVLAGYIAGLMARGLAPKPAAELAAWLHVECARAFGPGLIAEDLADMLPQVFRALNI